MASTEKHEANHKVVQPELLMVLADEDELNNLKTFHDIIVAVYRGDGVPQQWKDATIKVLTRRNIVLSVTIVVASPPWLTLAKYS